MVMNGIPLSFSVNTNMIGIFMMDEQENGMSDIEQYLAAQTRANDIQSHRGACLQYIAICTFLMILYSLMRNAQECSSFAIYEWDFLKQSCLINLCYHYISSRSFALKWKYCSCLCPEINTQPYFGLWTSVRKVK